MAIFVDDYVVNKAAVGIGSDIAVEQHGWTIKVQICSLVNLFVEIKVGSKKILIIL